MEHQIQIIDRMFTQTPWLVPHIGQG